MPLKYIIVQHSVYGIRYWNSAMEAFEHDAEKATRYDTEEEPRNRVYTNPKIPHGVYQILPIIVKQ